MSDLKFSRVEISQIEDKLQLGFGWVEVNVDLDDMTLDAHPGIEIRVPIDYSEAESVGAIRERAYKRAIECLRLALEGLSSLPPPPVSKPLPPSLDLKPASP